MYQNSVVGITKFCYLALEGGILTMIHRVNYSKPLVPRTLDESFPLAFSCLGHKVIELLIHS